MNPKEPEDRMVQDPPTSQPDPTAALAAPPGSLTPPPGAPPAPSGAPPAAPARAARGRRRERKNVPRGRAYVQSTFNNTIITLTDLNGNTLAWGSAGSTGVKGSRKSTPYAAQIAAENAARKAMDHGLREVDVFVKGPGSGRESAVRALQASGIALRTIRDITPIPHNGCRPRKRRRV